MELLLWYRTRLPQLFIVLDQMPFYWIPRTVLKIIFNVLIYVFTCGELANLAVRTVDTEKYASMNPFYK